MKVKLKTSQLSSAVKVVQKALTSRAQLPILSSIKIKTEGDKCSLMATDLFLGIEVIIPVKDADPGLVIVSGKEFRELVSSASGDEFELEVKDEKLLVKTGDFKANFSLFNAQEYPDFPDVSGETITLPLSELEKIEQEVFFAASTDQTRPLLTGVLLIKKNGNWEAVVTDGFRLSKTGLSDLDMGKADIESLLIPVQSLKEVINIARDQQIERVKVIISLSNQQLLFRVGDIDIYVRLLEGEYPPYEKIIPTSFDVKVEIDREQLLSHVKRALIFCQNTSNIIKFEIGESLKVSSISSSLGTYQGELEVDKHKGKQGEIAFNGRYLLDYLTNSDLEKVVFMMTESLRPAVFSWKDSPDSIYVVMPFRVNKA